MSLQPRPARNWRALTLSLFLLLSLFSLCGLMLLLVIFISGPVAADHTRPLTFAILTGGVFLIALLLLPAIYMNIRLFVGWPALNLRVPPLNDGILLLILALFWGLTLLAGQALASSAVAIIALPLLNVLAVLLPVIFLLRLALRKLNAPTMQQAWSVLALTLVIGPMFAMLLEMLAFGFLLLLVALLASKDAALTLQLTHLMEKLQDGADISTLLESFVPLLFTPAGLLMTFGLLSVAAPIIEEAGKVLALSFFVGQLKHPVQGFVLGALCGAAFALAENVGFSSTGSSEWMQSVIDRAVAILPHTLNSGILGWALVSARKDRSYFKLMGAYFAVILLHGAWNGISIALALSTITSESVLPIFANSTAWLAGQTVMMLGTFVGLIYCNAILRRSQLAEAEYNVPPSIPNSPNNGEIHGIP